MINQLLASVIIEAKTGLYDKVKTTLEEYAQVMKESQQEPGEDDDSRAILKAKEDFCWGLLDELEAMHRQQIDEVRERYPSCSEELDISTGYLQTLPNGWTRS